jgi:DNA (cytosine-5)-methyltransferase 1
MSRRRRLLDLFSGAGGCSVGYARAGFEVVGVDIEPHPDYPFEFHQGDAIEWLEMLYDDPSFIAPFDAIHASPVCHDWSPLASVTGRDGSGDLLLQTLAKLPRLGMPWVVENVVGAPLPHQDDLFGRYGVELCGSMFGLKVLRHRLFEASFPITAPPHGSHVGEFYAPAGHGDPNWKRREANPHLSGKGYADRCREAMGIDWMNRDELAQAIPPAYTEHIGIAAPSCCSRKAIRARSVTGRCGRVSGCSPTTQCPGPWVGLTGHCVGLTAGATRPPVLAWGTA